MIFCENSWNFRRILPTIAATLLVAVLAAGGGFAKTVSRYERFFAVSTSAYTLTTLIAVRKCDVDGVSQVLAVDPATLAVVLLPAQEFHSVETPLPEIRRRYAATAYCGALEDAEKKADSVADAGLTHFMPQRRGVDLTVDLCPSRRPLDRDFFLEIVNTLGQPERPLPIAVAVTGVWMKEHPDDMRWLLQLVNENKLAVTWVNHSYHHRVGKGLKPQENFLLEKGTDMDQEILETEKAIIRCGAVPSLFFRFPGLVSSKALFETVLSYGLIPLGSDAWLAKDQRPTDGSIVLVHANGNEPVGIRRFFKLIQEEKRDIETRQWQLLDLRESVNETDENKAKK